MYDVMLSGYAGGAIVIKDKAGKIVRTVLEKDAKNGQNVILGKN